VPDSDFRAPVDVFAVLLRGEEVLFTRRAGAIPGSGQWALPSGRLEAGEDVVTALRRELAEELGIGVIPADVRGFGVTHARPPEGPGRLGLGFRLSRWSGEPSIREPEKCSGLAWHRLDRTPEPLMEYTRLILDLFRSGDIVSRYGWD
jgi:8-oxo-dGTP pyrophosphatase MutT (NUDIX family)